MATIKFSIGSVRQDENFNDFSGNITINTYYFNVPANAWGNINTTIQQKASNYVTAAIQNCGIENLTMISNALMSGIAPVTSDYTFQRIRFYCSSGKKAGQTFYATSSAEYAKNTSGTVLVPSDGEHYYIYFEWKKNATSSNNCLLTINGNGYTFKSVSGLSGSPTLGYNSASINYSVAQGTAITLPTQSSYYNVPSGTTLLGYGDYPSGPKVHDPGTLYYAVTKTIYAIWSTSSSGGSGSTGTTNYTLSVNANGGTFQSSVTGSPCYATSYASNIAKYTKAGGTTVTLPTTTDLTRNGFKLTGYGDSATGQKWHDPGTSYGIPYENKTIYALWEAAEVSYSISNLRTLSSNNNTFSGTVTVGGYTFNPSTVVGKTTLTGTVTAYEAINAAIKNTGITNLTPITAALKSGTKPVCSGYTFDKFKFYCNSGTNYGKTFYASSPTSNIVDANGYAATIHAGESYTITLLWTKNDSSSTKNFTVYLNAMGGNLASNISTVDSRLQFIVANDYSMAKATVSSGATLSLPTSSKISRTGYKFLGWIEAQYAQNATSASYTSSYVVTKDVELCAVWVQESSTTTPSTPPSCTWISTSATYPTGTKTVTLKWKVDPASSNVLAFRIDYAGGYYNLNADPLAPGLTNLGNGQFSFDWTPAGGHTTRTITIKASTGNGLYGASSNPITLTFKDEATQPKYYCTVNFTDPDNKLIASTIPAQQTYRSDTTPITFTLPTTKPTAKNSDQEFIAWVESGKGAPLYYPGAAMSVNTYYGSVTLTPVVNYKEVTVKFYPNPNNGGAKIKYPHESSYSDFNTTSIWPNYTYNRALGWFPSVTREGYTFDGWFNAANGGTQITTATIATSDMNLYAHWTQNGFKAPVWITANNSRVKRNGKITLTWKKGDSKDTRPTWYQVVDAATGVELGRVKATGTESSYSLEWTAPSDYKGNTVKVIADDGQGLASPWSDILTLVWDKGTAPTKPASCTINKSKTPPTIFTNAAQFDADVRKDYENYDVSWNASTDVDGDLAGYALEYRTWQDKDKDPGAWGNRKYFNDPSTLNAQFPSAALAGFAQVQYRVAAYDQVFRYNINETGNISDWRESNVVSISEKKPPTVPSPVIIPEKIKANEQFEIRWGASTDPDGDLAGYRVEECRDNNGEWANSSPAYPNVTYTYRSIPRELNVKTVQYRVKAYDTLGLQSGYAYSAIRDVINNTPPTTPPYINIPAIVPPKDIGNDRATGAVKAGEPFIISWGASTDAENNLAGYELQRLLDGGRDWETIATTDREFYTETIDKTQAYHSSVAYRVRAFDEDKAYSGWCTSETYNVSNNASPVVTLGELSSPWPNGFYLGTMEDGFSFDFHVTDEENDRVDVEIAIIPEGATEEGKIVLATFEDRATPLHSMYTITDDEFTALAMKRFTVIVTAKDAEGYGKAAFSFTRKATRAFLTLKYPMTYPEFIEGVRFTRLIGQFPTDCIMKVEVTNNANDRAGTVVWEDCTIYARNLMAYEFKNKIAFRPAFNFRITLNRGPSGASGYISRISGYFITENTEQQF